MILTMEGILAFMLLWLFVVGLIGYLWGKAFKLEGIERSGIALMWLIGIAIVLLIFLTSLNYAVQAPRLIPPAFDSNWERRK